MPIHCDEQRFRIPLDGPHLMGLQAIDDHDVPFLQDELLKADLKAETPFEHHNNLKIFMPMNILFP